MLRLSIQCPAGITKPVQNEFVLTGNEATIGRSQKCDLQLPFDEVSRQHVVLKKQADGYQLVESSSNGSRLNGRYLANGSETVLSDGDLLEIAGFTLTVHIENMTSAGTKPMWEAPGATASIPSQAGLEELVSKPAEASGRGHDPLSDLGGRPLPDLGADAPPPLSHANPLSDSFLPAAPAAPIDLPSDAGGFSDAPAMLPDNWNMTMVDMPVVKPAQTGAVGGGGAAPAPPIPSGNLTTENPEVPPFVEKPQAPKPSAAPTAPVAAPQPNPPATGNLSKQIAADPERFAATLEKLIELLMLNLRARAEMKTEIRADMTLIQQTENNPLKFSVDAQDALGKMLSPPPGYLSLEDSVVEAFDDLRDHQLAMIAGLRSLFDNLLQTFDPERLEEGWSDDSSVLGKLSGKSRLWQNYERLFSQLKSDQDTSFKNLISEPFSRSYDKQIRQLKRQRQQS